MDIINFDEDYILENEKVILRPLMESDFDSLLDFSINESDIWSFNAFGADNPDNLKIYIDTALRNRQLKTDYPFVVIDKHENKVIGSTRFYLINITNKTLELGFTWYGKKYQGTHINKNCKYLLLELAFEKLNIERVSFKANSLNERSINAMKSIGCVQEGILRNFSMDAKGNRIDATILSILKDEWFNNVKQNLKNKIERY